ncbi:hypothetical protein BC828DRAFT_376278 [Blastocladiella britannica]|nr:hypothetical protein BC828DRAFT_376278 [Blastocladiella britannica]
MNSKSNPLHIVTPAIATGDPAISFDGNNNGMPPDSPTVAAARRVIQALAQSVAVALQPSSATATRLLARLMVGWKGLENGPFVQRLVAALGGHVPPRAILTALAVMMAAMVLRKPHVAVRWYSAAHLVGRALLVLETTGGSSSSSSATPGAFPAASSSATPSVRAALVPLTTHVVLTALFPATGRSSYLSLAARIAVLRHLDAVAPSVYAALIRPAARALSRNAPIVAKHLGLALPTIGDGVVAPVPEPVLRLLRLTVAAYPTLDQYIGAVVASEPVVPMTPTSPLSIPALSTTPRAANGISGPSSAMVSFGKHQPALAQFLNDDDDYSEALRDNKTAQV